MHADDEDRLTCPADKSSVWIKLLIPLGLLLLAALAWYFWPQPAPEEPSATPVPDIIVPVEPEPALPEPKPVLQVPQEIVPEELAPDYGLPDSVPEREQSDAALKEQLLAIMPSATVLDITMLKELAQKFTTFSYALAEGDVDYRMLPLTSPEQRFTVLGKEATLRLNPASYARYDAYAESFASLNVEQAVAAYQFFWPLLEGIFAEFGEPKKTLHGELLKGIALLLASPELEQAPRLQRPSVYYQFADPALEALPSAQKQLLRMGPENTRRIKSKLLELQQALEKITVDKEAS